MAAGTEARKRSRRAAMSAPNALPQPSPEALAHSARLVALIAAEIAAAGGRIGFERYMELALYAPGLGYYSAGAAKLGAEGDFITASERSTLYAHCLAAQCCEVLDALGGGSVLELGAGSGALAAELLAALARAGSLPDRYFILDISAELRARQRETIMRRAPGLYERVAWLDRLPEQSVRGVVIASEVVDALPVSLFRIDETRALERVQSLAVTMRDGTFTLVAQPASAALGAVVAEIEGELPAPLPQGFTSECRPRLAPWVAAIARALERGVLLVIDYGLPRREYYAPERSGGTLLCHYRHRVHGDPFLWPGLQDIGAWVDFTAVARAGEDAGLTLAGYTTQAHFLIGCGLAEHLADAVARDPDLSAQRASEAGLLTLPGQMGERFRVLALARGHSAPLRGFSVRDLSRTL